ncbi:MAG: LURP-one-related family protein [Candidatus Nanopelagicales bacterium]|jgi:uncharacterized protein YxjI|nr:LURP-one-related family protein [Candidatus Nanopelagicales bacterium]
MVDTSAPAPGWTRLVFKSKLGVGRDFEVTDTAGTRVLFVDGKIGPTPKAEVRDAQDVVLYTVKGHLLGIPKRMAISTADGTQVAELKAKAFSMVKDKMTMTMADGTAWQVQGTLMEKNYSIASGGQPIAQITQKWLTVRDSYTVDYLSSMDPGLVMAVIWAIDRWVERD